MSAATAAAAAHNYSEPAGATATEAGADGQPAAPSPSPTNDELEQVSLETQGTAERFSECTSSSLSTSRDDEEEEDDEDDDGVSSGTGGARANPDQPVKCSAVHALERDMPDFDYSHMVVELRERILEHAHANPGLYSQRELDKCRTDDWFLSRFLLRHKLDMELAYDQLQRTMRYHHESLFAALRPEDFPREFYELGGTFSYPEDRKGNKMLYMRVRVHRKTPEIKAVVEGFLYYNLIRTDQLANGRGIACVMDCTGGGLQNADLDMLFFFVSSLKSYFPRGLSYILVHNLPWILKPFWHLAKAWVSDEHRELIKFSNDRTVFEYIEREHLPDFMGGTCPVDYRKAPANCTNLAEACKLWGVDRATAATILDKFKANLPAETVERLEREYLNASERDQAELDKILPELDGKTMIAQVD